MPIKCEKCGKALEDLRTWEDVEHYRCFECHTEYSRIRIKEEAMPEAVTAGNSREEYEKTLQWARDNRYYAMLTEMTEGGYSADVNWRSLRDEPSAPSDSWRAFLAIAEQECDIRLHANDLKEHGSCGHCERIARACEKVARAAYRSAYRTGYEWGEPQPGTEWFKDIARIAAQPEKE